MTSRTPLLAGLFATYFLGSALASPAQDLFDQATFLIGFYYNGPAQVQSFRDLRKTYQPQLDSLCAVDKDKCGYDAARKVIQSIVQNINDPFTQLMDNAELANEQRYGAGLGPAQPRIGVWTRQVPQGLIVVESFPGEPAYEAGIRRGDVITSVGTAPATPTTLSAAEASKAAFNLSVSRQGTGKTLSLTAKVADQAMQPTLDINNGIAYLKVYHFYASQDFSTAEHIYDAVHKAEQAGAKGIVLDLRNSLTGYDSEALLAAGAFIAKGGFIYNRRFQGLNETHTLDNAKIYNQPQGQDKQLENQVPNPILTKLPVVVLVNRYTNNSAEMLAYFLQSAGRAKVVGEPTAGALAISGNAEGPLINGEFVAVSSLKMENLDGSPFPARVTPDVLVPQDLAALSNGRDLALEKALELLK
ncbi:MAG: PDZ domain-containing protein [Thermaceae bacterium]|nr:PDZ domain-containing protein [Thermaceae bacterium]